MVFYPYFSQITESALILICMRHAYAGTYCWINIFPHCTFNVELSVSLQRGTEASPWNYYGCNQKSSKFGQIIYTTHWKQLKNLVVCCSLLDTTKQATSLEPARIVCTAYSVVSKTLQDIHVLLRLYEWYTLVIVTNFCLSSYPIWYFSL